MLFLKLLSAIASLFAIYPLLKFARKDEINIFDLIILFHTVFFCFVPFVSHSSAYQWSDGFFFEDDIIFRVFIYYIIVFFLVLKIDIFWTKYYKYKSSILNITYYIKTLPQIKITWMFLCVLVANLLISLLWYLPQVSSLEALSELNNSQGNLKSPLYLLYGSIFICCFSFSLVVYLKEKSSSKRTNILLYIILGFALLLLFMPRRTMLFYLIISLIIIYSVKRDFFTKKKIACVILILFLILKIYFPFYNVMRRSNVQIDNNNYITSLIHVVKNAKNDFSSQKNNAAKSSERRALNLYYALYRIVKYDNSPSNGSLLIAAIDHAIPKYLNPNKGNGTEEILQRKMHCKTDQADSILLLGYGDFGLFVGAFYSFILFVLIICIHVLLDRFSVFLSNNRSTFGILLVVYLISFSWNVEHRLDGFFASFVHLTILLIVLMLLSKFNIIWIFENKKC